MNRKEWDALFDTPGAFQPLEGAQSPQDYETAIIGAAREAYNKAAPEERAKHPLNVPYLRQQAHRLYRHLHGGAAEQGAEAMPVDPKAGDR